jgi:hypothetical protein
LKEIYGVFFIPFIESQRNNSETKNVKEQKVKMVTKNELRGLLTNDKGRKESVKYKQNKVGKFSSHNISNL